MIYGSVCSGIEAATAAWHPLGWQPAFFSEIEPFPRAVLEHRWPKVPLHGDFTTIQENEYRPIELLVGGTPCQSFSVAGLRGGLADDRGNLALEYLRLADRLRPRWLVWENVPGVEAGEGVAPTIASRPTGGGGLGTDFDCDGGRVTSHEVAQPLLAKANSSHRADAESYVAIAKSLNAHPSRSDWETETFVVHALRADGFDASEDGTGRGTPLVPIAFAHQQGGSIDLHTAENVGLSLQRSQGQAIAFSCKDHGADAGELAPTLRAMGHGETWANGGGQIAVAFAENSRAELRLEGGDGQVASSLKSGGGKAGQGYPAIAVSLRGREAAA